MMKTRHFVVILLVFVFAPASRAIADIITYRFDGIVTGIDWWGGDSFLDDSVQIGTTFSGTVAVDGSAKDALPDDPHVGRYNFDAIANPALGFRITIGNYVIGEATPKFPGQFHLTVFHEHVLFDSGFHVFQEFIPAYGGKIPAIWATAVIGVTDEDGKAISSIEIPTSLPPFEYWDLAGGSISLVTDGPYAPVSVAFELTSLSIVPGPGGVAVFGLGAILALAGRSRRRTETTCPPRNPRTYHLE
jgi:hypothetical protein